MRRFADFLRETRANVTIMTALALPVLVMVVGGAMDYARKLDARAKLQSATDAALLATMAHKQQNSRITAGRLQTYFVQELRRRYNERLASKGLQLDKIELNVDKNGTATAKVKAHVSTSFMRLASINQLGMDIVSQAKTSESRTEVALVLDVTGSMSGSKLSELKRAARSFIETIYQRVYRQDASSFRIAIVPFSQYVNVGKKYRNASWIDVPPDGYRTEEYQTYNCTYRRCARYRYGGTRCSYTGPRYRYCRRVCRYVGSADSGRRRVCTTRCEWRRRRVCQYDPNKRVCVYYRTYRRFPCLPTKRVRRRYIKWEGCVGSRDYPLNLTDSNYGTKVPGVMNYTRDTRYGEMHYRGYTTTKNYCPSRPITPLKSVKLYKASLLREINRLSADGWTYIPAGLAWGWRVLSHKTPFTQGASDRDVKKYNVQRIIVLMTDGENTRAPDRSRNRAYKDHGSGDASYANRLTSKLCDNIKAINPATGRRNAEIITITFDVHSSTVKRLLRSCSTLGAYDVGTGQLEKIFRNIAAQLVELHLSR